MSTYAIGSDTPRWWWPSAAAGALGAAAITAILVAPTMDEAFTDRTGPHAPPALTRDPWVTLVDPSIGRECFAVPPRLNAAVDHASPLCGHGPATYREGVRRHGLGSRP